MDNNLKNESDFEIDILGSIEFDLTESIKDLFWNIKCLKSDIDKIKENLKN